MTERKAEFQTVGCSPRRLRDGHSTKGLVHHFIQWQVLCAAMDVLAGNSNHQWITPKLGFAHLQAVFGVIHWWLLFPADIHGLAHIALATE